MNDWLLTNTHTHTHKKPQQCMCEWILKINILHNPIKPVTNTPTTFSTMFQSFSYIYTYIVAVISVVIVWN